MKLVSAIYGLVALATATSPVWGAITYVDAVPNTNGSNGNTTVNGTPVDFTGGTGNATTSGSDGTSNLGDGLWHLRPRPTTNDSTVWEGDHGTAATLPENLITTLSLAAGTYNLYGLFWNNDSAAGNFDASFRVGDSGPFTDFNQDNATLASAAGDEFVSIGSTRDGSQWLMIADLGLHTVTDPIEIHVATPNFAVTGEQRTWYDGVGYAIIPEPSTVMLWLLGMTAVAWRRIRGT